MSDPSEELYHYIHYIEEPVLDPGVIEDTPINKGSVAKIQRLLDLGADPNYAIKGMFKVYKHLPSAKNLSIIDLLLENGVDLNPMGYNDEPLLNGNMHQKIDLIDLLLQYGADPNGRDKNGETALTQAVNYDDLNKVKLLLQYGADPLLTNKNGDTALDIAVNEHKNNIADFLRQEIMGDSRIIKAMTATNDSFETNTDIGQALCKQLDNDLYKHQLYQIAVDLNIPVESGMNKRKLCELLSNYIMRITNSRSKMSDKIKFLKEYPFQKGLMKTYADSKYKKDVDDSKDPHQEWIRRMQSSLPRL